MFIKIWFLSFDKHQRCLSYSWYVTTTSRNVCMQGRDIGFHLISSAAEDERSRKQDKNDLSSCWSKNEICWVNFFPYWCLLKTLVTKMCSIVLLCVCDVRVNKSLQDTFYVFERLCWGLSWNGHLVERWMSIRLESTRRPISFSLKFWLNHFRLSVVCLLID